LPALLNTYRGIVWLIYYDLVQQKIIHFEQTYLTG